ncbi:hypothetical protein ABENE_15660 [Asticcacaulis benevestitus DSM 16100 = ATCC BAA-896]|uniref:ATP-grasp fold PylC-type domain-containing protein n=2 Tax=Asticcacaulis TaxID=76890 RepID=V4P407_9CAUL|nr:hypothetical protein ABENE_15660 [Asticcacaulis benevestitus DSM 16100 = ATCC BAA-896]
MGCDVFQTALFGKGLTYRSPRFEPDGFAADAERIVEQTNPDLIVPLCEEIYYWAQLRPPALFAPSLETLMRLHSKHEFARFAAGLGLSVPMTERTPDWAPDSVFKPEFSRFGVRLLIRHAQGPGKEDPCNPWIRQAYVDGEDLSFYAIAREGRLRAFSAYRSAWRTKGGASYYFDPLESELSDRLLTIAATLVSALDLTGQIACDLRMDAYGKLWLLECNPRATSGLHLLAHDPAALASAFLADGDRLAADRQPACVGLAMALYGLPDAVRNGRLRGWRQDSRRARDVLAKRELPALADSLSLSLKAAQGGRGLAELLTQDIECNGRLS